MKIRMLITLIAIVAGYSFTAPATEIEKGSIKGAVFDTNTNQPLEYATISVFNIVSDSLIGGTITNAKGTFNIKGLAYGAYKVEITFIGYEQKNFSNLKITSANPNADLGNIKIQPAVETIGEAVVTSDLPAISYKIDKKVINVKQFHTSGSGTAVDILENYPSIELDINRKVLLRGSSNIKVLIDSRPTTLEPTDALNMIPASTIENIEIITNPSAKYDAEGTSGIINIITKKNKAPGITGMVSLGGGMYNNYTSDILLSVKKKKYGFFIGANSNQRGIKGEYDTDSWTRQNDTTYHLIKDGVYALTQNTTGVRGGFDIDVNSNNILSTQFGVGKYTALDKFDSDFEEYTQPTTSTNLYSSSEDADNGGLFYTVDLNYIHKFQKKGHEISALFLYNRREFDDLRNNELTDPVNAVVGGYKSSETGPTDLYNLQIDYTLPLGENNKLEAGYKSIVTDYDIKGRVEEYNPVSEVYELNTNFSNSAIFGKDIHSGYITYSGELSNFGYRLGLRAEYTYRKIAITETSEEFLIERLDYFPGIHLSYNLPKEQQLMASYSRRIDRPENWHLAPFLTWRDAYNVRLGNPGLEPEYIDSYEISYLSNFGKNRLNIEVYHRKTNNAFVQFRDVYQENVYLNTHENIGNIYSTGSEISLSLKLIKWWDIRLTGNLFDYRIKGNFNNRDFNQESFRWTGRFNNTLKLGKTTTSQITLFYTSPYINTQGEDMGYIITNFSVKQNFLKSYSATLFVTGLFGLLERSFEYEGPDYYLHRYLRPYTPIFNLTLSYTINNYRYDRKKHKNTGNMDDGESSGF